MTKNEVLGYLEKRLEILNKQEREDILAEYSQHIDNKILSGLSEEEAIQDFGNVEEFVDDILAAYKVDPDYNHKRVSFEYTLSAWLKKIGKIINAVSDALLNKDRREIVSIVARFLVLCLCLWIAKIPVELVANLLENIFFILPDSLYRLCDSIVNFCINIVYIVVVCYTIYLFLKRTLLSNYDFNDDEGQEQERRFHTEIKKDAKKKHGKEYGQTMKTETEERVGAVSLGKTPEGVTELTKGIDSTDVIDVANVANVIGIDVNEQADNPGEAGAANIHWQQEQQQDENILNSIKKRAHEFKESCAPAKEAKKTKAKPEGEGGFAGLLVNLFALCLKILVFFVMLPIGLLALGAIVGLGVLVVLAIQGVPVMGGILISMGVILCVISFIVAVYRILFVGGAANEKGL